MFTTVKLAKTSFTSHNYCVGVVILRVFKIYSQQLSGHLYSLPKRPAVWGTGTLRVWPESQDTHSMGDGTGKASGWAEGGQAILAGSPLSQAGSEITGAHAAKYPGGLDEVELMKEGQIGGLSKK